MCSPSLKTVTFYHGVYDAEQERRMKSFISQFFQGARWMVIRSVLNDPN